jgi:hypothetical protein
MTTTAKTRIHKTALMKEIIGYFDAEGRHLRGGDVINAALGKASESEMVRLEAWIESRNPRQRPALSRWLGGAISAERRLRERTRNA